MSNPKTAANVQHTMQLAEILSDLVSLRVCDPTAALALVSARANSNSSSEPDKTDKKEEDRDPDLHRAKELVQLHYEVREKQKRGELSRELEEARREVWRAVGGG